MGGGDYKTGGTTDTTTDGRPTPTRGWLFGRRRLCRGGRATCWAVPVPQAGHASEHMGLARASSRPAHDRRMSVYMLLPRGLPSRGLLPRGLRLPGRVPRACREKRHCPRPCRVRSASAFVPPYCMSVCMLLAADAAVGGADSAAAWSLEAAAAARDPPEPPGAGFRHRWPAGVHGGPGTFQGSQGSGAGVARAWRGRGAGYRPSFGLGGAGVARAWGGRGAGMSCDPRTFGNIGFRPFQKRCLTMPARQNRAPGKFWSFRQAPSDPPTHPPTKSPQHPRERRGLPAGQSFVANG
eukprot:gene2976-biopygen17121